MVYVTGSLSLSLFRAAKARWIQRLAVPWGRSFTSGLDPSTRERRSSWKTWGPLANSLSMPVLAPQVWLGAALSMKHASRACRQTSGDRIYFFSSTGSEPRPASPLPAAGQKEYRLSPVRLCQMLPAAVPAHCRLLHRPRPHKSGACLIELLFQLLFQGSPHPHPDLQACKQCF